MDIATAIRESLDDEWLPAIYRTKVRSERTRSYSLEVPQRENAAEILYTLLGIDLKVGKTRFACPDLATARYIRIFARTGCREFAIPYDITKISAVADDLETSWQKTLLLIDEDTLCRGAAMRSRLRAAVIKAIRGECREIGAGEAMPEFDRISKRRAP